MRSAAFRSVIRQISQRNPHAAGRLASILTLVISHRRPTKQSIARVRTSWLASLFVSTDTVPQVAAPQRACSSALEVSLLLDLAGGYCPLPTTVHQNPTDLPPPLKISSRPNNEPRKAPVDRSNMNAPDTTLIPDNRYIGPVYAPSSPSPSQSRWSHLGTYAELRSCTNGPAGRSLGEADSQRRCASA
jgi:hypothetical protein